MKKRYIKKQMDIAAQIHELLDNTGWTQKELSEKSGVPEQILSNIRSGHANPTLKTLVKIEDALEADIIVAPKFYKKALSRKGYVISKSPVTEEFNLDLEQEAFGKSRIKGEKQTRIYTMKGYQDNGYNMSAEELESQTYQEAI